ncbi:Hypothetical predicted protein, partial [Paramuricea clavata]
DPYSLQYVKVDDAIRALVDMDPWALMAKFDVQTAYRNILIHPDDRYLLGMKWRDRFYVDLVLPFGLRSAPFIFNSVAEAVEWILVRNYAVSPLFHYLDDYLTMGPANSSICQSHMDTAFTVFARLGLPLHLQKCEGSSTVLVFLGVELYSVQQLARLPRDKVDRILRLLQSWSRKKTCTRRDLESLIGSLHHACRVVVPGRTFLRRMIDLLCCFRHRDHPIRLNVEFRRDLQWWLSFFLEWNGVSFFLSPAVSPLPDLVVSSDASGSCGFGALWHMQWFYSSWFFLRFLSFALTGVSSCGPSFRSTPPSNPTVAVVAPGTACLINQCFGFLAQGLPPSTRRVYAAGQRAYFQFCSTFDPPSFPSSEWLLMLFATWLAQTRNLAPSSVSSYIAAVRSWHIDLGAPDPTRGATRLARLLRGIRRSRSWPALTRFPV